MIKVILMHIIKRFFTNPVALIIIAAALILFFTPVDDLDFIKSTVGGGLVIKVINALIAGLVVMFLVWLARVMRVLFENGEPNGISADPRAKAILFGAIYISMALVTLGTF